MFGFLAAEGGAAVRFGAALDELCLDFWPQEVAQQYGLGQLWGEFCLGFWPQEVALQYGSEQLNTCPSKKPKATRAVVERAAI